jgi:DNA helicase HerA-like ATPase
VLKDGSIYLGTSRHADDSLGAPQYLDLALANRHGLITGATGTGKTVSLQILAEGFSNAGVPVFAADVKGDLSGIAAAGEAREALQERAAQIGLTDYPLAASPSIFWDLFGQQGHPIRATVSEMGPLLLSRLLDLNDTQEGVLNVAFKLADEEGLLLLDLADLQALLADLSGRSKEISARFGNVTKPSVGAIQRQLLVLEQQGGASFFGEPALEIADLMRTARDGRGMVNILAADRLMQSPGSTPLFCSGFYPSCSKSYRKSATWRNLAWYSSSTRRTCCSMMPGGAGRQVEQVVKLIRSKGVGVYFVTQNPLDLPESVLAQLGNRVQHALRAYTPREQKAVKTAADTFRPNPELDTAEAITRLGVGEALISTLGKGGVPSMVERTLIRPPSSRLGPLLPPERTGVMATSPVAASYDRTVDRHSAAEMLADRAAKRSEAVAEPAKPAAVRRSDRQSYGEAAVKSVVRSVGSSLGRAIVRGIFGSVRRGR